MLADILRNRRHYRLCIRFYHERRTILAIDGEPAYV